jgi:hypothetical protein
MPGAIALHVYDGQKRVGIVIEVGKRCFAYSTADNGFLGVFASRKPAYAAVSAAAADGKAVL